MRRYDDPDVLIDAVEAEGWRLSFWWGSAEGAEFPDDIPVIVVIERYDIELGRFTLSGEAFKSFAYTLEEAA